MISWLVAVIIGIVVGLLVHSVGGGGKTLALSALAGLVGAVLGRILLGHSLPWHPHTLSAALGAVVLSIIWVAATRRASPKHPSAPATGK